MTSSEWMDLAVLERRKYNYLNEILDLTQQLAETLDRNDQVAAKMLVALRQDPIRHLEEVDRAGKARRKTLSEEERARLDALLRGAEPQDDSESAFLDQAGRARRLLERVVALDRQVSFRIAGDNSFYKK